MWQRDASKIQAAKKAVEQAQSLVDTQKKRQDTGYGMQLDVEQATIQLADRENDQLVVENNYQSTEVVLATTLNIPVVNNLEPSEPELTAVNLIEKEVTLDSLLLTAKEKRPELKDLAEQIKASKAQYQASYSDLFPTLGLGSYYGQVGPFSNLRDTYSRSISLNYDVLKNMGVATFGNIKSLRAEWQQTLLKLEKKNNDIEKNIADAYFDWQYQQKQLVVAEKKVKAAEQAERIAKARLTTGFGIQLEILKAQSDLAQARMGYYESIYQANVAQLRLLYETGQMTPEKLGVL
jgi:outer membrane protein TolC